MTPDQAINIVRSPAGSYRYPALREAWETLAAEVERLRPIEQRALDYLKDPSGDPREDAVYYVLHGDD